MFISCQSRQHFSSHHHRHHTGSWRSPLNNPSWHAWHSMSGSEAQAQAAACYGYSCGCQPLHSQRVLESHAWALRTPLGTPSLPNSRCLHGSLQLGPSRCLVRLRAAKRLSAGNFCLHAQRRRFSDAHPAAFLRGTQVSIGRHGSACRRLSHMPPAIQCFPWTAWFSLFIITFHKCSSRILLAVSPLSGPSRIRFPLNHGGAKNPHLPPAFPISHSYANLATESSITAIKASGTQRPDSTAFITNGGYFSISLACLSLRPEGERQRETVRADKAMRRIPRYPTMIWMTRRYDLGQ